MSSFHKATIECLSCRKSFPFMIHDSINVTLDPENKNAVLDRSIFQCECPHCHIKDEIHYELLYHDMNNGYIIQVCWNKEEINSYRIEGEIAELAQLNGVSHYRCRCVVGYDELTEKIRIFDAGLDDYVIESIKLLFPHDENVQCRLFCKEQEDEFIFYEIHKDHTQNAFFSVAKNEYREIAEYFEKKKIRRAFEFIYVDEEFLKRL